MSANEVIHLCSKLTMPQHNINIEVDAVQFHSSQIVIKLVSKVLDSLKIFGHPF